MSENPVEKCPECNGAVRRLVGGGSGLIFKGSGFYLTDYVKNKKTKSDTSIKSKNENKKTKSDGKKTSNEKTTKK
jgi:predicted nucleic acid-binding Zn ribbon protein